MSKTSNELPGAFTPPEIRYLREGLFGYDIHEMIAQGGMGAVYRGEQSRLERHVAIKVIPRVVGAEIGLQQRFETEAKVMAKLNHPHIVNVIDFGDTADGEFLYLSMELVDGVDLLTAIHHEMLSHDDMLKALIQTCEAIHYIHGQDVLHRDIKPSNILLTKNGDAKVIDFGLAHFTDTASSTPNNLNLGTKGYAAPEIFGLDPIDHRSDIYSLGGVIYEALTKLTPEDQLQRASSIVEGIDPRLDQIITKARQSDRNLRYQTAHALGQALQTIRNANNRPQHLPVAKSPSNRAMTPSNKTQKLPPPPSLKLQRIPLKA